MRFRPGIVNPIFLREAMLKSPADPGAQKRLPAVVQRPKDVGWTRVRRPREEADIEGTKMKRS